MIEIVKEGTLEKHGINMFGESVARDFDAGFERSMQLITDEVSAILASVWVIPELCGPMGRILK